MRELTQYEKDYVQRKLTESALTMYRVTFELHWKGPGQNTAATQMWEEELFPAVIEDDVLIVHKDFIDTPVLMADLDSPSGTITGTYRYFLEMAGVAEWWENESSLFRDDLENVLMALRAKKTIYDPNGGDPTVEYYSFADGPTMVWHKIYVSGSTTIDAVGDINISKVGDSYHIAMTPNGSTFPSATPPKYSTPIDYEQLRLIEYSKRTSRFSKTTADAMRIQAQFELYDRYGI